MLVGRQRPISETVETASAVVLRLIGRERAIVNPPAALLTLLSTCRTAARSAGPQAGREHLAGVLDAINGHPESEAAAIVVPAISMPVPLYTRGVSGRVYVDAGLIPVIQGWYAARGVDVQVDNALPGLPLPAPAAAWQVGIPDPAVVDAIRTRRGVMVRYDPAHVDPVRLVAQIALAWPLIRIVVACSRKAEVRRAVNHLCSVAVAADATFGGGELRPEELITGIRVWVATYRGVSAPHVDARRADVVVLLDAREALGQLPAERVLGECHGRVVGLLPEHERLSHYERDRLWALTGMPPVYVPRHGLVRRAVRVVHVKNDAPVVPPDGTGLELLRQGVWRHPARNRRLARLASLLRAGRLDELAERFPAVASTLAGRPVGRVIVLASVVEHAERLAGLIRDAALVTSPTPPQPAAPPAETDESTAGTGLMVVTPDALGTIALGDNDVIVRADAGVALPPGLRPEHLFARQLGPELVVVDVADRHHPELRRAAHLRELAYHAEGWAVGPHPCQDAVRAFVSTRPRRAR